MSAISGFCEKCNKFWKRHCDGNRNTCMSILFDTIEALQAENEQLQARAARYVELLRKTRKALHKGISELKVHCKYFDQTPEEDACIEMHETALEIDKVLGENG